MKPRRAVGWLSTMLVSPAVLYLGAANVYLNLPGGAPGLHGKPEKLLVTYAWGYTIWPSRVVLRSFAIHGQSRHVAWEVKSDRVSGSVDLRQLRKRRFVATGVSGTGVTVDVKRREKPPDADSSPADQSRPPWTISLPDVTADVREMTLDTARIGPLQVRGGMELHLKKDLRLAPTHVEMRRAEVRLSDAIVATPIAGTIDLESDAFAYRGIPVREGLSHFSGALKVSGEVRDASSLTSLVTAVPFITLEKCAAHLDATLTFAMGQIVRPSSVALTNTRLVARLLDYRARGDGRLSWSLAGEEVSAYALDAKLDAFDVTRDGFSAPHVEGRGLMLHASGDELPFGDATVPIRVTVELPEATVPRLDFYNAYLPPGTGLEIVEGHGTLHASFEAVVPAGEGTAHLELVGRDVKARYREASFSGRLLVETRLPHMDLATRTFAMDGTRFRIDDGVVAIAGHPAEPGPWWLEGTVRSGSVHPGSREPLQASLDASLLDSRPLLALFTAGKPLPGWIERAVRIRDIEGTALLGQTGDALTFDRILVTGSGLELRGKIRLSGKARQGVALLSYGSLALGIGVRTEGTDFKILAPRKWYEAQGGP